MAISVTTSGPVSSDITVSLDSISSAIADDIDDTQGEYTAAITRAVQAAQRFCEREIYYFNETRDITFSTVADQEWYTDTDEENIASLKRIVAAYCEDSNSQRTRLRRATPEELELWSDNSASTGEPYCFTYFDRQIRLYPIPDQVYTIRLQAGPYDLGDLQDGTDVNAWLTEAYDLIKARAKYILARDTLKDAELAAVSFASHQEEHVALKAETSRRNASGFIRATCF